MVEIVAHILREESLVGHCVEYSLVGLHGAHLVIEQVVVFDASFTIDALNVDFSLICEPPVGAEGRGPLVEHTRVAVLPHLI